MNFENHFKPEDIATAEAEFICILDLMVLATANIESQDFEQANERLRDILKSIKRMEVLSLKKQNEALKQDLGSSFKDYMMLQIVRGHVNEK